MKITAVDIFLLNVRPPQFQPVVCRVRTDQGFYGYGEASMGFDTGAKAAFAAIRELSGVVLGENPMENQVLWERMASDPFWCPGGGTVLYSAVSAIDTALWDIKAKVCGVPLYMLLGGKQRRDLRAYASQLQFGWEEDGMHPCLGYREEDLAHSVEKAAGQGYDAVKINCLQFDDTGEKNAFLTGPLSPKQRRTAGRRLAAVRQAAGEDVDLIVEMHGRAGALAARELAEIAASYGALFLEEPCPPMDLAGLRYLREKSPIPLAAGERVHGKQRYAALLREGLLQILQPDIGNCGGVTEAKKICDMACAFGVGVQLHVCGSPIALAAALHLGTAIPNFILHEQMVTALDRRNRAMGRYDYQPVDGRFAAPEVPGIGQELSEEAVRTALLAYTVE